MGTSYSFAAIFEFLKKWSPPAAAKK
jgi:hypothetical protein